MNRSRDQQNRGRGFSRGRSSFSAGRSQHQYRYIPVGTDGPSSDDTSGSKYGVSKPQEVGTDGPSSDDTSGSKYGISHNVRQQGWSSLGGRDNPSLIGTPQQQQNSQELVSSSSEQHLDIKTPIGQTSIQNLRARSPLNLDQSFMESIDVKDKIPHEKVPVWGPTSSGNTAGNESPVNSECLTVVDPYDICLSKTGSSISLKPSLLSKNREKRNEMKRSAEGQKVSVLRPGMVLLKNYISYSDQVNTVKACQRLGVGPGGFYQPGYRDGAKLQLKMMCLGKDWDPEKSEYGDRRSVDGAKPPIIPNQFHQLVKGAIQESHAHLSKGSKASNPEGILPWMSPNICIVNFYTTSGRLGLHQDKDESEESLQKGLPVVSFSIGDSAEFLYGDQRDIDKANKTVLESGDVLIFGGKSRHVFHGVSTILPNTAPKGLLEETKLRPGRLNLTFRQY